MKLAYLIGSVFCMNFTMNEGPTFSINIENKDTLKIEASVPNSMWLGIGFGHGMKGGVDMVQFRATGSGIVQDLWSTSESQPAIDSVQSYTGTTVTQADSKYNFVTYRKLDTGETTQDSVIKCGSGKQEWGASVNAKTADSSQEHTKNYEFDVDISEDCVISLAQESAKRNFVLSGAVFLMLSYSF